ncbi:hypothetical protein J4443_01655 [Candidatus Woesearchaeota archaeon]|nr:hypothetical protein [Candidatus Woesearchaeota archaeon]
MKVILDTNFLIDCAKFNIDYEDQLKQHHLFTLGAVIGELEKLIKQKKAKHAKLALQILRQKQIKIIKTDEDKQVQVDVDSILASNQFTEGYAIATADKDLKKKLKNKKIFVIRQKKYIKEIK